MMREKQREKDEERRRKINSENMWFWEVTHSVPLYKKFEKNYIEKVELPSI